MRRFTTIEDNSPLRFLDMDVGRYMYETYYPTKINREWKQLVMDQLKHHYKIFTDGNDNQILMHYRSGYAGWHYKRVSNVKSKLFLKYILYKSSCKIRVNKNKNKNKNKN